MPSTEAVCFQAQKDQCSQERASKIQMTAAERKAQELQEKVKLLTEQLEEQASRSAKVNSLITLPCEMQTGRWINISLAELDSSLYLSDQGADRWEMHCTVCGLNAVSCSADFLQPIHACADSAHEWVSNAGGDGCSSPGG